MLATPSRATSTLARIAAALLPAPVVLVAWVAACAGGAPEAARPAVPEAAGAVETGEPPAPASAVTPAAPAPAGEAGDAGAAPKARRPHDCSERLAEITNDPPEGGVVMSNAMTAADAGASDRLLPLIELVKGKREAFRCCFDLWARDHPGQKGRVTMTFDLAPDGALKKATVRDAETDLPSPEALACMLDLAPKLEWPRSPSGKDTQFTYRFEFKARP